MRHVVAWFVVEMYFQRKNKKGKSLVIKKSKQNRRIWMFQCPKRNLWAHKCEMRWEGDSLNPDLTHAICKKNESGEAGKHIMIGKMCMWIIIKCHIVNIKRDEFLPPWYIYIYIHRKAQRVIKNTLNPNLSRDEKSAKHFYYIDKRGNRESR